MGRDCHPVQLAESGQRQHHQVAVAPGSRNRAGTEVRILQSQRPQLRQDREPVQVRERADGVGGGVDRLQRGQAFQPVERRETVVLHPQLLQLGHATNPRQRGEPVRPQPQALHAGAAREVPQRLDPVGVEEEVPADRQPQASHRAEALLLRDAQAHQRAADRLKAAAAARPDRAYGRQAGVDQCKGLQPRQLGHGLCGHDRGLSEDDLDLPHLRQVVLSGCINQHLSGQDALLRTRSLACRASAHGDRARVGARVCGTGGECRQAKQVKCNGGSLAPSTKCLGQAPGPAKP
mmetsp:Transcript_6518/g.26837  ORF Transcript_6518/g.26837 Transcript_6518/m.26837 type:complete len:292 (+) Transcript_6518:1629-2504(+)